MGVYYNIDTKKFVYHVVPKIDYAFAESYVYEQVNNEILGMNPDYYYIIMNTFQTFTHRVTILNFLNIIDTFHLLKIKTLHLISQ